MSSEVKSEREAEDNAKADAEAQAEDKAKAESEADAKARAEAEAREQVEAEAREKEKREAEAKAKEQADAAEAAEEAKQEAKKERLELEAKAKADKAKAAKEERRLEAESRAKQIEELVAKQRAADRAARAALNTSTISPAWGSGTGGWLSKITQAASEVASATMPVEEPPKSTNPWNSDRGGKSTTNADDAKPEAPAKPALRLELSTAFTISSPGPGTQTLDDEWSSFEKAEDGGEGPEARNQMKKLREKAKKQLKLKLRKVRRTVRLPLRQP